MPFRRSYLKAGGGYTPCANTSTRAKQHIRVAEKSKESLVEISAQLSLATRGERVHCGFEQV